MIFLEKGFRWRDRNVVFQIRILRIWVTQMMLAALILAKTEEGHQQEHRFGSIWINARIFDQKTMGITGVDLRGNLDPLAPKMSWDNRWKRSTSKWIWRYVFHILYIYTHTEFRIVFGAYRNRIDEFLLHLPMTFTMCCCFLRSKPPQRGFSGFTFWRRATSPSWGMARCGPGGPAIRSQARLDERGRSIFFFEVYEIGFTHIYNLDICFSTSFLNALRITTILYWLAISLFIYPLYKSGGSAGDQTTIVDEHISPFLIMCVSLKSSFLLDILIGQDVFQVTFIFGAQYPQISLFLPVHLLGFQAPANIITTFLSWDHPSLVFPWSLIIQLKTQQLLNPNSSRGQFIISGRSPVDPRFHCWTNPQCYRLKLHLVMIIRCHQTWRAG